LKGEKYEGSKLQTRVYSSSSWRHFLQLRLFLLFLLIYEATKSGQVKEKDNRTALDCRTSCDC